MRLIVYLGAADKVVAVEDMEIKRPSGRPYRLAHPEFGTLRTLKKTEDDEKPVGEWNTYEIIADGETVTLKINDKVVNQATGCGPVAGKICLTAEGDEIHFRKVRLLRLPVVVP